MSMLFSTSLDSRSHLSLPMAERKERGGEGSVCVTLHAATKIIVFEITIRHQLLDSAWAWESGSEVFPIDSKQRKCKGKVAGFIIIYFTLSISVYISLFYCLFRFLSIHLFYVCPFLYLFCCFCLYFTVSLCFCLNSSVIVPVSVCLSVSRRFCPSISILVSLSVFFTIYPSVSH